MIKSLDHVAIPIDAVEPMLAFYKAMGFVVKEELSGFFYSVCFGDNKINLHTKALWQDPNFVLRGNGALPGSADLCFVWGASMAELMQLLEGIGVNSDEGPVEREGGRQSCVSGGCKGQSVYLRDPDKNLLEFIVYND